MGIQKCIGPFFPTTLCEVLVFGSVCRPRPPPPPLPPLCHNTIFHTQLCHTLICHTQSFTQQSFTQQFFTQPLSHTQSLTHNFVTQQFFTHNFVTHTHSLWHLATSTCLLRGRHGAFGIGLDLRRGTLRGRRGTWRHPRCFCVAGMALMALGWVWWLVVRDAAALCVAGVALGDIDIPFAWQAWHLVTSTFHLRGRPGKPCRRGRRGRRGSSRAPNDASDCWSYTG